MLTETRRKEGSGERGRGKKEKHSFSLSRAQNLAIRDVYFVLIECGPQRAQECRAWCLAGGVSWVPCFSAHVRLRPLPWGLLPSPQKGKKRIEVIYSVWRWLLHSIQPTGVHLLTIFSKWSPVQGINPSELLEGCSPGRRLGIVPPPPGSARSATHTRAASALLPCLQIFMNQPPPAYS